MIKRAKFGEDQCEISLIFAPNICIEFWLASFKQGFIYYFSTREEINEQHVFDDIYCFKPFSSMYMILSNDKPFTILNDLRQYYSW